MKLKNLTLKLHTANNCRDYFFLHPLLLPYYALPLIDGALSDDAVWRLSVTYIRLRTERPRKKICTRGPRHVIQTPLSRSKGQGHQAALLTAAHSPAAAMTVGTYWPLEPTATLRSAGAVSSAARGASAPTEGGEGRGHIVAAARLQFVLSWWNDKAKWHQYCGYLS